MAGANHVTVRMFNVGFGDSFLLTFPAPDRPRRVLIDCGVHSIGPGPTPMREMVGQIIKDVTDEDGTSRIDIVIASHRHQDHVSGFRYASWENVEVGEVWMPWTEHPKDPEAKQIREAQSTRARKLQLALMRLGADEGVMAMAENNLTNAAAMATLHKGFRGVRRRRFLPSNETERTIFTPLLPGVEVHVLGPSRNRDVIRDMEPEEGESYLQFRLGKTRTPVKRVKPFRDEWALPQAKFSKVFGHLSFTADDRERLANVGSGTEFELVTQLERAVNGTSLMLMFVVGRAHLLFPGDAQWGTWTNALADPEWRELLSKTTFYKVGHHASHNATPPVFVETSLRRRFSAMISTRPVKKWPEIPRAPLLEQLRKRSPRVVRSDLADVPDPLDFKRGRGYVEANVPIS